MDQVGSLLAAAGNTADRISSPHVRNEVLVEIATAQAEVGLHSEALETAGKIRTLEHRRYAHLVDQARALSTIASSQARAGLVQASNAGDRR